MQSIVIPFSGFYESIHDSFIDHAIEQLFTDHETGEELEIPESFYQTSYCTRATFESYAREYLSAFQHYLKHELEIDISLTFESLESPREYNFSTDRIFAKISLDDIQKLMDCTNQGTLKQVIDKRHTSRSGFHSFYTTDLEEWLEKPLEQWDHNELQTLLIAAMDCMGADSDEGLDECAIMESSLCNGVIDDIVFSNMSPESQAIVNEFDNVNNTKGN